MGDFKLVTIIKNQELSLNLSDVKWHSLTLLWFEINAVMI